MIIIYAPADGAEESYDVGPGRLRASEIQVIERTADARWEDLKKAIGDGDLHAMRAAVWALKKRTQPSLRFGDFDPFEGELRSRLDETETRGYAQAILDKLREEPEELAAAFDDLRDAAFDREAADAVIADVTAPKDPGPAPEPEPSPASPTGS